MKTLYLECNMGAAGDMLMGALLELLSPKEKEEFLEELNHAGIPHLKVTAEPSVKCGITGTHMRVSIHGEEEESLDIEKEVEAFHSYEQEKERERGEHAHTQAHIHSHEPHAHGDSLFHSHVHHTHHHAGMKDIAEQIEALNLNPAVKADIRNIYHIIAQAEGQVHGCEIKDIHFHEVGTADALADITGCAMLFHKLGATQVLVSPVTTGFGQVRCSHGILPVPAPATARILEGIPCSAGRIEGELCTPTGAAILRYYASAYGRMQEMKMEKIGYGMGKKDFPAANCVRAVFGDAPAV